MLIERRIAEDRLTIQRIGSEWLPPGTPCALAIYPDHWNVGDTAIWCGTRRWLDVLKVRVDYACDAWSYDPSALEKALPKGPILLCGGGNFGDVYPNETTLRARILDDLPHRQIIQLPQSIWFQDSVGISAMAKRLARQQNFTLMVRDAASLDFARQHCGVSAILCPDAAIFMECPPILPKADVPVLALWRDDVEMNMTSLTLPAGWKTRDWLTPGDDLDAMPAVSRMFLSWVEPPVTFDYHCPKRRARAWKWIPGMWEKLAHARVQRGFHILSQGQVVITNRLHAHLLCLLMKKPHVVCDTGSGKTSAYRKTWPLDDDRVQWADHPDDAVEKAKILLERYASGGPTPGKV